MLGPVDLEQLIQAEVHPVPGSSRISKVEIVQLHSLTSRVGNSANCSLKLQSSLQI
jgi:hypothetical protein